MYSFQSIFPMWSIFFMLPIFSKNRCFFDQSTRKKNLDAKGSGYFIFLEHPCQFKNLSKVSSWPNSSHTAPKHLGISSTIWCVVDISAELLTTLLTESSLRVLSKNLAGVF